MIKTYLETSNFLLKIKILQFIKNYTKNFGFYEGFNEIIENKYILTVRNVQQIALSLIDILRYKIFQTQKVTDLELSFINEMSEKYSDILVYSRNQPSNQIILDLINQTVIQSLLNNSKFNIPNSMFYNLNNPKVLNILLLTVFNNVINNQDEINRKLIQNIDLRLISNQNEKSFLIVTLMSQNYKIDCNLRELFSQSLNKSKTIFQQYNFMKCVNYLILLILQGIIEIDSEDLNCIIQQYQQNFFKFLPQFPQQDDFLLIDQIFQLPQIIECQLKPMQLLICLLDKQPIILTEVFIQQIQFYLINGQFNRKQLSILLIQILKQFVQTGDNIDLIRKILDKQKIQDAEIEDLSLKEQILSFL